MQANQRIIAFGIVLALAITSSVMHGQHTLRWGAPDRVQESAERLASLDLSAGDWRLLERQVFDKDVLSILKSVGYFKHIYINDVTGERVAVAIMLGPVGPMVAHRPEICYSSAAYERLSETERVQLSVDVPVTRDRSDSDSHELFSVTFRTSGGRRQFLRVYYAWSKPFAGELNSIEGFSVWRAPQNPRMSFADEQFLYRLQVATNVVPGEEGLPQDSALRFLRQVFQNHSRDSTGFADEVIK